MRLPDPPARAAELVLDADAAEPPRRLRIARELGLSASAQFSAAGWAAIETALGRPPALYLVDLRQESHGFLNGAAVSWYAPNNWDSAGLGPEAALALEAARLAALGSTDQALVGDADAVKQGIAQTPQRWPRHTVHPEAALVAPGRYLRVPVLDHLRPSAAALDAFVTQVRGLPPGAHLHFHCRGGRGRATLMASFYDMLQHAGALPQGDLLARQRALHDYDLLALPDAALAKAAFAPERAALVGELYAYARANPGGRPRSFTEWSTSPSSAASP